MIVVGESAERQNLLGLVTQADHAGLAGRLLSLWRVPELIDNPRRDDILFAAREHDNGWWEADSAPRIESESGAPHHFRSFPREARTEVWIRGIERFRKERPYAALLIALHARALYSSGRGRPELGEFFAAVDERIEALLAAAAAEESEAADDYRWVDLSDLSSLALCEGWREPFERHQIRGLVKDETLHLDPFPFAGSTVFEVPCRWIPNRPYTSDTDLAMELACSRWDRLRFRVAPRTPEASRKP